MKSLNEAYGVLRNSETRREYDARRTKPAACCFLSPHPPRRTGLLGQGLSAFFCLIVVVSSFLVRQWIWFLWPLAILATLVIMFGIMMARSAMRAVNASPGNYQSVASLHARAGGTFLEHGNGGWLRRVPSANCSVRD